MRATKVGLGDRERREVRGGSRSRLDRSRSPAAVTLALVTAIWVSPGHPAVRPAHLLVAPDVQARLDVLADALQHEIVLCLLGRVGDGRAVATDLYMPVPISSTTTTVVTGPCPASSVATWHNHPTTGTRTRAPGSNWTAAGGARSSDSWSAAGERSSCHPSRRDVTTAVRLRIPFLVIADGTGNQCIWPLEQLEALVR